MTRRSRAVLLGALALLLAGCASSISVNQDYDPRYDFSQLRTFGYLNIPADASVTQLQADRVSSAITTELVKKGYTLSKQGDFGIAIHFGKNTVTDIQNWGYGWRAGWGNVDVTQYQEGTLIIDFIDMKDKQLIWRGTGKGALPDNPTVEQRTAMVNSAVASILAQFPPKNR